MDVKHAIKYHAAQNVPLNYDEAYELGLYVLKGCAGDPLAQVQSIAILCALHNRATYAWEKNYKVEKFHGHRVPKSAAEQIAGLCAAIFEHDIATSEFGFINPPVERVMDNCGMGGDLIVTANISTISAFIAASNGINMGKHGSPSNADNGRHGSSDFVSLMCGIDTYAHKLQVEQSIAKFSFGYTEALDTRYKHIHMQTHEVAFLPHMNDIIGPITNPINPKLMKRRVLGVNHVVSPKLIAEVYQILNQQGITFLEHGLFVRGLTNDSEYEGIDEVSICKAGTEVAELKDGKIKSFRLLPSDFNLEPINIKDVSPPPNCSKGEYSLRILQGEFHDQRLQIVLANAALLFLLDEQVTNLKDGYKMAESVFHDGKPLETMLAVHNELPINDDSK